MGETHVDEDHDEPQAWLPGYSGKRKMWAKEDAAALGAGKNLPLSYLKPGGPEGFCEGSRTDSSGDGRTDHQKQNACSTA